MDRQTCFARLKRDFDHASAPPLNRGGVFTLGCDVMDARLGGGLARGALHEVCAAADGDRTSASGFALMLALRAAAGRVILWVREDKAVRADGTLYAPGLAELGMDAEQVILVHAPDTLAALRAGAEILDTFGVGAVILEPFGMAKALDLTASRKLVLAAERGGAGAFLLRDGKARFASAAATRWQVAAAPSSLLAGNAPGHPAFAVSLLRHRGGIAPFDLTLDWTRDEQIFTLPAANSAAPLSRTGFSGAERRPMAA
jgi:protein ImuA